MASDKSLQLLFILPFGMLWLVCSMLSVGFVVVCSLVDCGDDGVRDLIIVRVELSTMIDCIVC